MVLFYTPPKKTTLQSKTINLQVHSLDAFGQGIAHYQGKTVFVSNALPTENVEVKLTENKKQYAKGHVLTYLTKSEMRIAPKCEHYSVCGGCQMQHIPLSMQHDIKIKALTTLFNKEAQCHISTDEVKVIHSSPYHYRRRARLAVMFDNNRLVMGFRKSESNQIIDIKSCPVLVAELERLLVPLRLCLNQLKDKKALGHIELIHTESGTILALRHIRPFNANDTELLVNFAQNEGISLYLHGDELVHLAGHSSHYYCVGPLQLTFSPLDFIQVNGQVNGEMIEQAIEWLSLKQEDRVLDLFCGMGNFSLPMATISHDVTGVEGVAELVTKAQDNGRLNHQFLSGKIEFFVNDLDKIINNPAWLTSGVNKILLDPARAGAYQVMNDIIEYSPEYVVYISCNPATLVRDSIKLLQAGYKINQISILDMFPQTKHIESMLLFKKLGTK